MSIHLNKEAFWDVDFSGLDEVEHADFIIARVFQFGLLSDLRAVIKTYTPAQIGTALKNYRGLDEKALNLAKVLGYI